MQAYLGLCVQCKLPVWGSKSKIGEWLRLLLIESNVIILE